MTPALAITILVAAACGLVRRTITTVIGALLIVVVGAIHLLLEQPHAIEHALVHVGLLVLAFNLTWLVFGLLSATLS